MKCEDAWTSRMRRLPICVLGIYASFVSLALFILWAAVTGDTLAPAWVTALLAVLAILAICTVWTSVSVLRRGSVYQWLRPERRPRRWVLIALMQLFAVFCIWFPVWIAWPHARISRVLLILFGCDFALTGITLKWLVPLVDYLMIRWGWDLR